MKKREQSIDQIIRRAKDLMKEQGHLLKEFGKLKSELEKTYQEISGAKNQPRQRKPH